MKSPIEKALEKLDLSTHQTALLVGVSAQTIRGNLRGDHLEITPKLLSFLTSKGYDPDKLEKDYLKYREWKRKQIAVK